MLCSSIQGAWRKHHPLLFGCQRPPLDLLLWFQFDQLLGGRHWKQHLVCGCQPLPLRWGDPVDTHQHLREDRPLPGGELLPPVLPVRHRWVPGSMFSVVHPFVLFLLLSWSHFTMCFAFSLDSETRQGWDRKGQQLDDSVDLPELLEQSLFLLPSHFWDRPAQRALQKV